MHTTEIWYQDLIKLVLNAFIEPLYIILGRFYFESFKWFAYLVNGVSRPLHASLGSWTEQRSQRVANFPTRLITLMPKFSQTTFSNVFFNGNIWISIKISLKFVPKGPINNISALVQIMAWCRPGNKSLPKPMMASLLTHICVTRPQWVNHGVCLTLLIPNPEYFRQPRSMHVLIRKKCFPITWD